MKKFLCVALLPCSALLTTAQDVAKPVSAEALMVMGEDETVPIWIVAATKTDVRYMESAIATDTKDMKISRAKSIYLMEPKEFTQAIDLFQARKYAEAKPKFAALKARYKFMESMRGNHSVLSAFYELECLRKLGDLEGLATGLRRFIKDPLARGYQLKQVDIYVFWDAVRTKSWQRIDALAKERRAEPLPNFLRAQVAYCHGLALEGLGKPGPALNAYNIALTADSGASEEITRLAALNIMRIHKANPAVQLAIKLWRTPDENKNTQGYFRLLEAASVARLYQLFLGSGTALPAEFKDFLKYQEGEAATPDKPADKPDKPDKEEE
ncbi:MAG: hypothetical protein NTW21_03720 [Verrucomicrobia bacterium]|nr:hypothetical protein [Verrucomicrobiota bacterium]